MLTILAAIIAAGAAGLSRLTPSDAAQNSTPIPLALPTNTATAGPPSETPTRTPTSEGRPMVEAIDPTLGANVRSGPDINAARIGQIFPGEQYPVLGKSYEWYQIEFPDSPTGTAWVHQSVVTISGDESLITEIAPENVATVDPGFIAAQQTAEALQGTPGSLITLTAQAQITPTGIFTPDPNAQPAATLVPGAPLPTFTPPTISMTPPIIPDVVAAETPGATIAGIPALIPILALAGVGLLGLLIAFVRRL